MTTSSSSSSSSPPPPSFPSSSYSSLVQNLRGQSSRPDNGRCPTPEMYPLQDLPGGPPSRNQQAGRGHRPSGHSRQMGSRNSVETGAPSRPARDSEPVPPSDSEQTQQTPPTDLVSLKHDVDGMARRWKAESDVFLIALRELGRVGRDVPPRVRRAGQRMSQAMARFDYCMAAYSMRYLDGYDQSGRHHIGDDDDDARRAPRLTEAQLRTIGGAAWSLLAILDPLGEQIDRFGVLLASMAARTDAERQELEQNLLSRVCSQAQADAIRPANLVTVIAGALEIFDAETAAVEDALRGIVVCPRVGGDSEWNDDDDDGVPRMSGALVGDRTGNDSPVAATFEAEDFVFNVPPPGPPGASAPTDIDSNEAGRIERRLPRFGDDVLSLPPPPTRPGWYDDTKPASSAPAENGSNMRQEESGSAAAKGQPARKGHKVSFLEGLFGGLSLR